LGDIQIQVTDKAMDMKELAQGLSVHLRSYQKKKKKTTFA
jgi:hypothetical protein